MHLQDMVIPKNSRFTSEIIELDSTVFQVFTFGKFYVNHVFGTRTFLKHYLYNTYIFKTFTCNNSSKITLPNNEQYFLYIHIDELI